MIPRIRSSNRPAYRYLIHRENNKAILVTYRITPYNIIDEITKQASRAFISLAGFDILYVTI